MSLPAPSRAAATPPAPRRAWEPPRVDDLPRLTDLTLQTTEGIVIEGTCSGSTCF